MVHQVPAQQDSHRCAEVAAECSHAVAPKLRFQPAVACLSQGLKLQPQARISIVTIQIYIDID